MVSDHRSFTVMIAAENILTALGGAFIGGLIAQIGQLLQVSREKRKVLYRVLHAQLDVWFAVLRSDTRPIIGALTRVMGPRLPLDRQGANELYDHPAFAQFLSQLIPEMLPADLETRYARAVQEVADVDPLLAYQLSGRTELAKYIQTWRPRLESMVSGMQLGGKDLTGIAASKEVLDQAIRAKVLTTLEHDILDVARAISWQMRRRAKTTLVKAKRRPDEVAEAELGSVIGKLLEAAQTSPADAA